MNDRSSITHSNSELNICPHVKGSTKSKKNRSIDLTCVKNVISFLIM